MKFMAEDGEIFSSAEECVEYEKNLLGMETLLKSASVVKVVKGSKSFVSVVFTSGDAEAADRMHLFIAEEVFGKRYRWVAGDQCVTENWSVEPVMPNVPGYVFDCLREKYTPSLGIWELEAPTGIVIRVFNLLSSKGGE